MKTTALRIPTKTLEDLIAAHLYAMGAVNDNQDVEILLKSLTEDGLNLEYFPIPRKRVKRNEEIDVISNIDPELTDIRAVLIDTASPKP